MTYEIQDGRHLFPFEIGRFPTKGCRFHIMSSSGKKKISRHRRCKFLDDRHDVNRLLTLIWESGNS